MLPARLQVAVDICALWTASLLHVRLGLRVGSITELVRKRFSTVSIEKACSCWAVWDQHLSILRQVSCSLQLRLLQHTPFSSFCLALLCFLQRWEIWYGYKMHSLMNWSSEEIKTVSFTMCEKQEKHFVHLLVWKPLHWEMQMVYCWYRMVVSEEGSRACL